MSPSSAKQPPWGLAWLLAVGQIVVWGTLYYSFPIIVGPMELATGWSRPFLNGGLSLGLLVWGLCALPVGAWIRRRGGRSLMTSASLLGGIALMSMGVVAHPVFYLANWVLLGVSMSGLLYEPSFAVVTAAFGAEYRRGITLITLVAGFASTVFMPLTQLLVEWVGWRETHLVFGALLMVVGVPLHWFGLQNETRTVSTTTPTPTFTDWVRELTRDIRDRRFVGLAIWFTAHAAIFSGMTFLLVPMLQSASVEPGIFLIAIALIGPMQVLGRIVLATRGSNYTAHKVGWLALSSLAIAITTLLLAPLTLTFLVVFAAFYGLGNGVMTILRGTVIAEIFGRERYAELNGALSAPAVFSTALAPLTLSALWTISGNPSTVLLTVLSLLAVSALGLFLAAWQKG